MDLSRLLRPRSIAVVGASERPGSYGGETLLNLGRLGFEGEVWGVHPTRASAHGVPCFPSLGELPAAPDAVVVAIPAAATPAVVDEAGALGCGGAVVFGAGFAEAAGGAGLQAELAAAARRHGLPVCGPNGNGIVSLPSRAALWGDALGPVAPGEVALVSQSGNVAVNALATRRGLRLHTVVSCGNQAVLDAADFVDHLAGEEGVRSIALYLEDDGDGARLCDALQRCAERGVGVAVLKVAFSAAGALAAAAHTGAVAGDQRVFRALVEEAGAAWAQDVHELLELAKALAVQSRESLQGGLGVLTCSGGDSALAADECARLGVSLPPLTGETAERLAALLPSAATVGNPLDYTSMIWGEPETLGELVAAAGADPGIDRLLVLYDQPAGIEGAAADSWAAVREGILRGAEGSPVPVMVASTLPELLDDEAARRFAESGVPAIAGLRTGLACAAELMRPPASPARLGEIAAAARRARTSNGNPGRRLAEHEAKALLHEAGVPVPLGRVVASEDEAAAALADLGAPVALKLSIPELTHKSDAGALALGLRDELELRSAFRRLAAWLEGAGALLVERMEPPGMELLVAARSDAVVPAVVVGLGGIWAELHDDVAIVPLPATPERVELALRSLRGAALLTGGRGRPALDVAAAAALAARVGELLLDRGLSLIELNPIIVHERGAVAVDAIANG